MVDIIVCVKQALDVADLKVDPSTRKPKVEETPRKISDFDKNALEEAVRLKEKHGGKISVVTLGGVKLTETVKETLAIGADEAYILDDQAFGWLDTLATAQVLVAAIRKIEEWDLILCGEASIDGYSAQVGPRVAEELNIPQMTYARSVTLDGNKVVVERSLEDSYETVEAKMPALVTVIKEINEPRLPTLIQIMGAAKKPMTTWNADDLGVPKDISESVSAVKILGVTAPKMERKNVIFKGEVDEAVDQLVKTLAKEGLIR